MEIRVNGEIRRVQEGSAVADLLAELGYGGEAITALRRDGVVATPAELRDRQRAGK